MTRADKYDMVNACKTPKELATAMRALSVNGMIKGRTREFSVEKMIQGMEYYMKHNQGANFVTREFGLRAQAVYIKNFWGI